MAGRIHGFLGGVLMTSSLTYLTAYEFKSKQNTISKSLLESSNLIEHRNDPIEHKSNVVQFTTRDGINETVKDIWNEEVIRGVNWLYSINLTNYGKVLIDKIAGSVN
ncbi:hypothetical protein B5S29_g1912 [[Candida] boidinii]|nr:hypothetical protein B5S29_g1912 [[Candida] boidinii]